MKKPLFLILLVSCFQFLQAQVETLQISFNTPKITQDSIYQVFEYANCSNFGEYGNPEIPYKGITYLLPQGTIISEIRIVDTLYTSFKEDFIIRPSMGACPLMLAEKYPDTLAPNPLIYNSTSPYPSEKVSEFKTSFLAGHSIGNFSICPIVYIPSEQKVKFLLSITLEIETTGSPMATYADKFLKNSNAIINRVDNMVVNPEKLKSYSHTRSDESNLDLLIVSNNTLLPSFQNYVTYKETTGYRVFTESVEDINLNYTGVDLQEKIRNCIIDYYTNNEVGYVILGGDSDGTTQIVPHRGFHGEAGAGHSDNNIPADIYYSNLDGTWNTDNDGSYGEDNDDWDLFSEIVVGRLCVDNPTEVANITNKLIKYQDDPVINDIEKALMVGGYLWDTYPEYGSYRKEQIAQGSNLHGYQTAGISDNFTIGELYERDMTWNKNDLSGYINDNGVNLINHLAHAQEYQVMKIFREDISSGIFTNDGTNRGYFISYSQGCYAGAFDNRLPPQLPPLPTYVYSLHDCIIEEMTTASNGAVCFVGNSRFGVGRRDGLTNGPSQVFDRQFFDAVFGENITQIGKANHDSKEDNAPFVLLDNNMRWCFYTLTLFGDPSLDIWTSTPTNILATYPAAIDFGTSEILVETNTPNARIGLVQDGQLIGRGITDETGNLLVELFNSVNNYHEVYLTITAHNKNKTTGIIYVPQNTAFVAYDSHGINDIAGNDNNLIDYGESVMVTIDVKNIGDLPAIDVTATLLNYDPYITLVDNTASTAMIITDQTISLVDEFQIQVSDNIPEDGYKAKVYLNCSTPSQSWVSYLFLELHCPKLELVNYLVLDPFGNNNGEIEPGEDIDLSLDILNSGLSDANDVEISLVSSDPYITINQAVTNCEDIMAGKVVTTTIPLSIHADLPLGHEILMQANISSNGNYEFDEDITLFFKIPVSLMDTDLDRASIDDIDKALTELNIIHDLVLDEDIDEFALDYNALNKYRAIFLSQGSDMFNYQSSLPFTQYLESGGKLYLEGRVILTPTQSYFTPYFGGYTEPSSSPFIPYTFINGELETFTSGMSFLHNGTDFDAYRYHIFNVNPPAFSIFKDHENEVSGIANENDIYKSIASIVEFEFLSDGLFPSTKKNLMQEYLDFFGISPICGPIPADISAWWPFDAIYTLPSIGVLTSDLVGQNDGFLKQYPLSMPPFPDPIVSGHVSNCLVSEEIHYVKVPNDPAINFGYDDFSFAVWFKGYGTVFDKRKYILNTFTGYSLFVSNRTIKIIIGEIIYTIDVDIPEASWNYLAFSCKRISGNKLVARFNDLEFIIPGAPIYENASNNLNLTIGANQTQSSLNFIGNIDELMFFSRALTSFEMRYIFQVGPYGVCKNNNSFGRNALSNLDLIYNKGTDIVVNAYPNPSNDILHVFIESPSRSDIKVTLVNQIGILVWTRSLIIEKGSVLDIDVSGFKPGVYSLIISDQNNKITERVIIF